MIDRYRLIKIQARTLLDQLQRHDLAPRTGDPVREVWSELASYCAGDAGLARLTAIWQKHGLSALNATCSGLNHQSVNAAVFLALYSFCREDEGYRPAQAVIFMAHALAFRAGLRRANDADMRALFDEYEEMLEAAYRAEGPGILSE